MLGIFSLILENFHIFVLVSTFVYYIVLRFYKSSVINQAKKNGESSNLIYILFVPALLYLTRFLFFKSQIISNNYYNTIPQQSFSQQSYQPQSGSGLDRYIKSPYPDSTVSSASITI